MRHDRTMSHNGDGAAPGANQWGAIRVRGARENNLRDISLDIPKRQLTVFTGVSGSGKSSLVFETIAAESRRLINETYTAFVQGFMATPPRPDVESLEITITGGMCAECEGLGRVSTVDVDALVDRNLSLNEGAITFPNFGVGTWYHRIFVDSGFFDPDKPLRDFTDAEWQRLLYGPEAKVKTELITLTYEGLVDKIGGRNIADCSAMQISDLAAWVRSLDAPGAGPMIEHLAGVLDTFVQIGLG